MSDEMDAGVEEYLQEEENPVRFRFTRSLDENDYEIVDEEELQGGPTKEELQAEVEKQKAELEAARLQPQGLGKDEILEILKEARKANPSVPVPAQQQQGESDEDFIKRINSDQFEGNLGQMIVEAVKRFSPQYASPALQGNFEISKELVENSPDLGPIYRKYQEEIEGRISQIPMNQRMTIPHIYKRATEEAASKHWRELREMDVKDLVAEEVKKIREELGLSKDGKPTAPSGPIYSESSINRPAGGRTTPSGKKRIPKPTPMEEKYANFKGVSWPALYETLQSNPQLKKRINEGGIPWLR